MSVFSYFKNKGQAALQLLSALLFLVLMLCFNGTGDEGDSVTHFLYAKWAWQVSENLLNHWAKPFYVLLASPFAQFGFNGIKVFNVLNFLIAQYCVYRIAEHLKFSFPIVPALLYLIAPMNIYLTLSGLTEPLFAAVLALCLLWTLKDRLWLAALLMSFLPFIRTEGLLFCGLWGAYFLITRHFKYIPALLVGHAIYSVAGFLAGKKISWVFTENPYAFFSSNYGHGSWNHFFASMPEIIGFGMFLLLAIGLIVYLLRSFSFLKEWNNKTYWAEIIFLFGGFIVFFAFHTFAWAKGFFNSFGLLRVFIGIMPVIVLLSAAGLFSFCNYFLKEERVKIFISIIMIALIINDFTPKSSYAFNKQTHFFLRADQELDLQIADFMKKEFPGYKNQVVYFQAPYLSETLGINIFDTTHYRSMHDYLENKPRPANYFIVWDDWYAPVDAGVKPDMIQSDSALTVVKVFETRDFWNNPRKTILYKNK